MTVLTLVPIVARLRAKSGLAAEAFGAATKAYRARENTGGWFPGSTNLPRHSAPN